MSFSRSTIRQPDLRFSNHPYRQVRICVFLNVVILAAFLFAGTVTHGQDDWGGAGTYAEPYFAVKSPTHEDGYYSCMGQDMESSNGTFLLRQRECNAVTYVNAAGFVDRKSQNGGTLNFEYDL